MRCNKAWYLDTALTVTGNLDRMEARSFTFSEIQAEIAKSNPVCSRVGWYGGGGHFQAIAGWLIAQSGTEYIDVSDPIYLNTQIAFAQFASHYQSGGTWTHSYVTKPPPAGAAIAGVAASSLAFRDESAIGA